ncbi:hypothetical protein [Hyphomonas sp.]|uniref:hypothetical protein n=1 Tax=Hyphomonas sp. TaxID=87 RepID=UPI00391D27F7
MLAKTLKRGLMLALAASMPFGLAGPASAQGSETCWIDVRSGPAQGVLQAYAAPRLAGSYELTIRQDGGNGELFVDQSGSFSPYNAWPTQLSRVHVGASPLRSLNRMPLSSVHSAQPGTTVISSSGSRPGALPVGAYGFRADLRVYDTAGRLICRDTRQWR